MPIPVVIPSQPVEILVAGLLFRRCCRPHPPCIAVVVARLPSSSPSSPVFRVVFFAEPHAEHSISRAPEFAPLSLRELLALLLAPSLPLTECDGRRSPSAWHSIACLSAWPPTIQVRKREILSGLRVYRHDNKTAKGTAAQPAAGYLAIPFAAFRVVSGVTCTLRQSSNTYFCTCDIQLNLQLLFSGSGCCDCSSVFLHDSLLHCKVATSPPATTAVTVPADAAAL